MKLTMRFIVALLAMVLAASSFADGGAGKGCKPLGSWLGYDQDGIAWWMTTGDGQNASHGTLNLEVPGSVMFFPGADGVTEMRGIWERMDDYVIAWTVVGFAYDANKITLGLARVSGKSTMSTDCNSELISDVLLEVFTPDADVNTDEPQWTMEFPDHYGYRIKLVSHDLP